MVYPVGWAGVLKPVEAVSKEEAYQKAQAYFESKSKYPNSWYLHDDFYDQDGNRLQPS